jgi:hypothetical protein
MAIALSTVNLKAGVKSGVLIPPRLIVVAIYGTVVPGFKSNGGGGGEV